MVNLEKLLKRFFKDVNMMGCDLKFANQVQKHLEIYTWHKTLWSRSRPTYCYRLGHLWAGVN